MKKTLRTFVAVEISQPIRARAAELIAALANAPAGVKWVEPHNLHLTLKFLGEVHQREAAAVCRAVEQAAGELPPFQFEVRGAGAFPSPARPRTVWIGAGKGDEQMVELHDRIEVRLAALGFREEHRRFQPHLTIGRARGGMGIAELGEMVKQHADFTAGVMLVEKTTVFSSTLTPDGPIHESIGTARLGGA
ncbi:MAG: RNA 2',3'-cyclic phosphodiesterase [Pirellulaceae bacterium]|nr:RNA 2',3'-cyclic phosphodiesterase [Pirellulaceae bacterium]